MNQVIFMKDIVEENGKTVEQNNLTLTHKIPLDTLVEVNSVYEGEEHESHGVRGFIASHDRDCDGTPLYSLSWKKGQRCDEGEYRFLANADLSSGWDEDSLTIIK